jgi:hypothetical protein
MSKENKEDSSSQLLCHSSSALTNSKRQRTGSNGEESSSSSSFSSNPAIQSRDHDQKVAYKDDANLNHADNEDSSKYLPRSKLPADKAKYYDALKINFEKLKEDRIAHTKALAKTQQKYKSLLGHFQNRTLPKFLDTTTSQRVSS